MSKCHASCPLDRPSTLGSPCDDCQLYQKENQQSWANAFYCKNGAFVIEGKVIRVGPKTKEWKQLEAAGEAPMRPCEAYKQVKDLRMKSSVFKHWVICVCVCVCVRVCLFWLFFCFLAVVLPLLFTLPSTPSTSPNATFVWAFFFFFLFLFFFYCCLLGTVDQSQRQEIQWR